MMKKNILAGVMILVVSSLLLAACAGQKPTTIAPTVDANLIYTQAAQTVQASIAQTDAVKPPEPTATQTPQPEPTIDPNMAAGMTATANAVLLPGNATATTEALPGQPTATSVAGVATVAALPTATSAVVAKPPTNTGDKGELISQDPGDGSKVGKSDIVTTTLVFKNVGTTTWSTKYVLAYYAGDRMGSPANFNMPHEVKPNETVKLVFQLKAPDSSGTKKIIWVLQNADAVNFYSLWLELDVK